MVDVVVKIKFFFRLVCSWMVDIKLWIYSYGYIICYFNWICLCYSWKYNINVGWNFCINFYKCVVIIIVDGYGCVWKNV